MKIKIILFFFFSSLCFAQIGFENGYYKDNKGTIVNCLIKNRNAYKSPTFIEIKTNDKDQVITKTIAEVSEFKVDGYPKYLRATVDIDDFVDNYANFSDIIEPTLTKSTVFLKLEAEGDANLYSYTKENFQKFYFSTNQDPIKLLIFKKYLVADNKIAKNNLYKNQLSTGLVLTDELRKKLDLINYKLDDLVQFFNIHNKNNNSETTGNITKKKNPLKLRVKAGIVHNNFESEISENNFDYFSFPAATNLGVGFEIEHFLNFGKNKWSVYVEPIYESFKGKTVGPQVGAFTKNAEISLQILNVGLGVKHNMFLNKTSAIFVSADMRLFILMSEPNFTVNNKIFETDNTSLGSSFGVGYKYNDFSLEYKLRTGINFTDSYGGGFDTKYVSFAILLGYTIF